VNLESKRPPKPLFRVGRDDDAWAVPDWAYAKEDRTFGNRFDDPAGVYRVLYASSQRLGCFIETLARFRVDVSFVADLALMENGEDDYHHRHRSRPWSESSSARPMPESACHPP